MADQPGEHFVTWFLSHQGTIYRYIVSLLPNLAEADDVFQHTCLILWNRHEKIQSSEHFIRMAYKIALNEVRNTRRRLGKRGILLNEQLIETLAVEWRKSAPSDEIRIDALKHCLGKLASRTYLLIQQYYRGDCAAEEIAAGLGISLPALRMKVHRIRRRLADCIGRQIRLQEQ